MKGPHDLILPHIGVPNEMGAGSHSFRFSHWFCLQLALEF